MQCSWFRSLEVSVWVFQGQVFGCFTSSFEVFSELLKVQNRFRKFFLFFVDMYKFLRGENVDWLFWNFWGGIEFFFFLVKEGLRVWVRLCLGWLVFRVQRFVVFLEFVVNEREVGFRVYGLGGYLVIVCNGCGFIFFFLFVSFIKRRLVNKQFKKFVC